MGPAKGCEPGTWLLLLELGWNAQLLWCCSQLLWLLLWWASLELLDRLWPELEWLRSLNWSLHSLELRWKTISEGSEGGRAGCLWLLSQSQWLLGLNWSGSSCSLLGLALNGDKSKLDLGSGNSSWWSGWWSLWPGWHW